MSLGQSEAGKMWLGGFRKRPLHPQLPIIPRKMMTF